MNHINLDRKKALWRKWLEWYEDYGCKIPGTEPHSLKAFQGGPGSQWRMVHAFHASTAAERGPRCVKIPEPVCGTVAAEPLISKEICELERWRSAVTQGAIAGGAFLNGLLCKWTSGLSHVPGVGEGRRRGNLAVEFPTSLEEWGPQSQLH